MRKQLLSLCFIFLFPAFLLSQQAESVINSNYLIEKGISPKVLDAAFNSLLQDGGFTQNMKMELLAGEETDRKALNLEMIFDPNYKQGLDIRYVYNPEIGLSIKKKKLRNLAESTHIFSRTTLNYFYDESSLKLLSKSGNDEVIAFHYRKELIPSSMKHIKKLKGVVYINDGKLDYVVITNDKPFRNNGKVIRYQQTSYFRKAENAGGYLVSATDETIVMKKGSGTKTFNNKTTTTRYFDDFGKVIRWEGDDVQPLFINSKTDTVKVGLGPIFPIFGRQAKKVGFDIPRPFGFDIFTHLQEQKMQFTDLSLSMNDSDTVSFNSFFDFDNSKVLQTTGLAMGRADMWVFPFFDIMVLAGVGTSQIDAPLKLDQEFKEKLEKLGWLIGIKPDDVPDSIPITTTIHSSILGGGATLAWGYKNFNISISGMYMRTKLEEAHTTNTAWVISPLVGYMTPWFNVMAGAQAQFYDTRVTGNFQIDTNNVLNYNVDFVAQKWNFIAGIYKDMWKHFVFSAQFGFGSRQSMTVIAGYRI
jgi:hypothetical protein